MIQRVMRALLARSIFTTRLKNPTIVANEGVELTVAPISGLAYIGILAATLRVVVGFAMTLHGYPKLKGGWRQSGQWIRSMGVPAAAAVLVTILEFFGGIFLIIGLIVPVVAGLFVIQFLAITIMKKWKMNGALIAKQGQASYEVDVTYLLLSLALLVLGAGTLSLDQLLGI